MSLGGEMDKRGMSVDFVIKSFEFGGGVGGCGIGRVGYGDIERGLGGRV